MAHLASGKLGIILMARFKKLFRIRSQHDCFPQIKYWNPYTTFCNSKLLYPFIWIYHLQTKMAQESRMAEESRKKILTSKSQWNVNYKKKHFKKEIPPYWGGGKLSRNIKYNYPPTTPPQVMDLGNPFPLFWIVLYISKPGSKIMFSLRPGAHGVIIQIFFSHDYLSYPGFPGWPCRPTPILILDSITILNILLIIVSQPSPQHCMARTNL